MEITSLDPFPGGKFIIAKKIPQRIKPGGTIDPKGEAGDKVFGNLLKGVLSLPCNWRSPVMAASSEKTINAW